MGGQEQNKRKAYQARAISPEPKKGQSYSEFGRQRDQITDADLVQLYGAFSLAQVYAHEEQCSTFVLDLTSEAEQRVQASMYAGLNLAWTLELDYLHMEDEDDPGRLLDYLHRVKGLRFCCEDKEPSLEFGEY